jgi:outer membrane protein
MAEILLYHGRAILSRSDFMMKKMFSAAAALALLSSSSLSAHEQPASKVGVVSFEACLSESKYGKKEMENFENIRKQMASMLESTDKELRELHTKREDIDYMDSLSPKADEEMKAKIQELEENKMRYTSQFSQVLQHTNQQMMQKMIGTISIAAEKVAQEHNLDYVLSRDVCFYIRPDRDVTSSVVKEMDNTFELSEAKKTSENKEGETADQQAG